MKSQGHRMSRLVQDLLSLSRIETNEHKPPSERIALEPVLRAVAATLELEARRKDMRVALEADAVLPDVTGAEDELPQVIQTLLDNAITYGRPATEVTIAARRADRVPAGFPGRPPGMPGRTSAASGNSWARTFNIGGHRLLQKKTDTNSY